jgi:hypothetical protein
MLSSILVMSLAVACVAWTVTQEEVFKECRQWCVRHRDCATHPTWKRKLAYLPTCPYCFSHYVAGAGVLAFKLWLVEPGVAGAIAAWFATVFVANIYLTAYHALRQVLRLLIERRTK